MSSATPASAFRWARAVTPALLALVFGVSAQASRADGPAVSWGSNFHGELGAIYRDTQEERPVAVEGQANIVSVAAGGGTNLAVLGDGSVSAWGGNVAGQLGDGTKAATWEKGVSHVTVKEVNGARGVATNGTHSVAVLADGTVKTWGNNQFGQLGNGGGGFESETHENQTLARPVGGLVHAVAVATGWGTDFALMSDHTVEAWGWDNRGQLGVYVPEACRAGVGKGVCPQFECKGEMGWQLCSKVPRPVEVVDARGRRSKLEGAVAIGAGGESAYALLSSGEVAAWGGNSKGQLGLGPNVKTAREFNVPPALVVSARTQAPLQGVVAIAAGFDHALALLGSGEVVGWGDDQKGALGPSSQTTCFSRPCDVAASPVPGLTHGRVSEIAAGVQYSLALSEGTVYALGNDENGELGDGATANSTQAKAVKGLSGATAISAGEAHVVAVLPAGAQTPAPLVAATPQSASIQVGWSLGGLERITCGTFEPNGSEAEQPPVPSETVPLEAKSLQQRTVTIKQLAGKPLQPRPYLIRLRAGSKIRATVAAPHS